VAVAVEVEVEVEVAEAAHGAGGGTTESRMESAERATDRAGRSPRGVWPSSMVERTTKPEYGAMKWNQWETFR
jgi:hypothetical protein